MTLDLLSEPGTWEAVAYCLITVALVYFDIKALGGNTEIYKGIAGCIGIPVGCGLLLGLPFVIIGIAASGSVEPRPIEERVLGLKMIAGASATLPLLVAVFRILGNIIPFLRDTWPWVDTRPTPRFEAPKPPRPQTQARLEPADFSLLDRLLAHRLVGLIGFISALLGIITFVLHLLYKW